VVTAARRPPLEAIRGFGDMPPPRLRTFAMRVGRGVIAESKFSRPTTGAGSDSWRRKGGHQSSASGDPRTQEWVLEMLAVVGLSAVVRDGVTQLDPGHAIGALGAGEWWQGFLSWRNRGPSWACGRRRTTHPPVAVISKKRHLDTGQRPQ